MDSSGHLTDCDGHRWVANGRPGQGKPICCRLTLAELGRMPPTSQSETPVGQGRFAWCRRTSINPYDMRPVFLTPILLDSDVARGTKESHSRRERPPSYGWCHQGNRYLHPVQLRSIAMKLAPIFATTDILEGVLLRGYHGTSQQVVDSLWKLRRTMGSHQDLTVKSRPCCDFRARELQTKRNGEPSGPAECRSRQWKGPGGCGGDHTFAATNL
jgi:hypothetical protein